MRVLSLQHDNIHYESVFVKTVTLVSERSTLGSFTGSAGSDFLT